MSNYNPLDGIFQKSLDPRILGKRIRDETNYQATANTQEKSNNGK